MKTATDPCSLKTLRKPVVLAAGFFDGLHRGHRRVISRAVSRARRIGGQAWVLTFDRHPLKLLDPGNAPLMLTSNRHRARLLEAAGVDGCLLVPFTRALAATTPGDFVERLHACIPTLAEVLVGRNWRFGRGGRGTPALMAKLGRRMGFRVVVTSSLRLRSAPVSSTRVRRAVIAGNLAAARVMLGRPFSVLGRVVRGRRVGRTLGFPTANVAYENEVLPPPGVYAVRARTGEEPRAIERSGVLNLGIRPTFGGRGGSLPVMELHLLDFSGNLYGQDMEVFFIRRLRDERRFASPHDLAEQIACDAAAARARLGQCGMSANPALRPISRCASEAAKKAQRIALHPAAGRLIFPPEQKKEVQQKKRKRV